MTFRKPDSQNDNSICLLILDKINAQVEYCFFPFGIFATPALTLAPILRRFVYKFLSCAVVVLKLPARRKFKNLWLLLLKTRITDGQHFRSKVEFKQSTVKLEVPSVTGYHPFFRVSSVTRYHPLPGIIR